MLKSKESYANEKAYSRAFFLHNSHVTDYPIDPIVGSFIRVIKPHEDQPMGDGKGYYTRPQVMFFGNGDNSRFYDLTDMVDFKDYLEIATHAITKPKFSKEIKLGDISTKYRSIFFKTDRGEDQYLIATGTTRPKSYTLAVAAQLMDSVNRIIEDRPPQSSILTIGDMMMTMLNHPGNGVRSPIVITARYDKERKVNYIVMEKVGKRMTIPDSSELSATDYIVPFLDTIEKDSEALLANPSKERIVTFVKEQDPNMEYVNTRFIDGESGQYVHVMFNSDRYPANNKMTLTYNPEFHKTMKETLVTFCNQFSAF